MRKYMFALLGSLLVAVPVLGAQQEARFITIAGSDVGYPYDTLDGICFFQRNTAFIPLSIDQALGGALDEAVAKLKNIAKSPQVKADALVQMRVTPMLVPNPLNPKEQLINSGVYVCGDFVRRRAVGQQAALP